MPVMLSAVFAVFIRVRDCVRVQLQVCSLIMMGIQLNLNAFAESVTTVATPLSETVCGLPGALSAIERMPFKLPATVGANVTLMVQPAPAGTLDLQLSLSVKLLGGEMLEMFSGWVP
jgi:hypothetical protein